LRAAALLAAIVAGTLCAAAPAAARWSAPAALFGCAAGLSPQAAPLVVFPSSEPQIRSGSGALLWSAPPGCGAGGAGPAGSAQEVAPSPAGNVAAALPVAPPEALGATLAADDLPGPGRPLLPGGGDLAQIVAAAGTAAGQVVAIGPTRPAPSRAQETAGGSPAASTGALAEGRSVGAFAVRPLAGPVSPAAASSSYLGDTVLASPVRTRGAGWAIAVRVQRHYSSAFAAPRLVPAGPDPVSAVAATMDYRADTLLAWAAGGAVYAREIARSGAVGGALRLGGAGSDAQLGALISDDGHAIVAWLSQSPAPSGGSRSTLELSLCEASAGAGAALSARSVAVERFRDPAGYAPPPDGSLRLVRLSSEAVMMAWTGIHAGRYAVRASPVSLRRGAWAPVTISTPGTSAGAGAAPSPGRSPIPAARGEDAVLADLVPGPHAEALALWTAAPRLPYGGPDLHRQAILAALGHYAGAGEVAFAAPEEVALPGPNGRPAAAIDPRSGQALAAWVQGSRVAYALRAAGPASAPLPVAGDARGPGAGLEIPAALAAFALAGALAGRAAIRRAAGEPRGCPRARRG
jgi:hypothetical protein